MTAVDYNCEYVNELMREKTIDSSSNLGKRQNIYLRCRVWRNSCYGDDVNVARLVGWCLLMARGVICQWTSALHCSVYTEPNLYETERSHHCSLRAIRQPTTPQQ